MPKLHESNEDALAELRERDDHVALHSELGQHVGMPASTVCHRSRVDGPWQRLLPGVVLLHSGEVTDHQRLVGAVKYAGRGAVVSGTAALAQYGFKSVPRAGDVLVLVPHARRPAGHGYVVIERTRNKPRTTTRRGVPCATVERAVIDACRRLKKLDQVREIVAEAVQSRKCRASDLVTELRHAQRRGSALPRQVMREISAGIRSVAEAKAREIFTGRGIRQPRWNVDLEDSGGQFIVTPDGYWDDVAVALELDSMAFHLSPRGYKRTQRRQQLMGRHGIIVIPVAPRDIIDDPDGFATGVDETLRAAHGRPLPNVRIRKRAAA